MVTPQEPNGFLLLRTPTKVQINILSFHGAQNSRQSQFETELEILLQALSYTLEEGKKKHQ